MKKKLILSVMLIILVIVASIALVACGESNCKCGGEIQETREIYLKFHYMITTQYSSLCTYKIGSIINKPETPTYEKNVFNGGYGKAEDGFVSEYDLPIENPRMEPGYDANKNYRFIAWYTEPEFLYQWDFSEDRVYRDITLYAKWQQV